MGTAAHQIASAPVATEAANRPWPAAHILVLLALWLGIFAAALTHPPLLDDADSTHAQAAQAMLSTGDWVTLHVDGIRYLEKPPLPYWITALSLKLFHVTPATAPARAALAVHLPLALTVLGLALLAYAWSRRAYGNRAALYAATFILTSAGVFLFTRVFIPDALLSLLLAFALYAMLRALDPTSLRPRLWAQTIWLTLALAVLTKGFVALVFFFSTALLFLFWTKQRRRLGQLMPFTGILLFLAVAAPWHILAGLRNTGGVNGHGFFWFYFINEHVLRFLGRRLPRDYNKLPAALYWSLHLIWLFPWSLFAPAALLQAWRNRKARLALADLDADGQPVSRIELARRSRVFGALNFARQTTLLLILFSTIVLVFFSLSTNQEYYTFPVYLPLLMLLASALANTDQDARITRWLSFSFGLFTVLGLAIAAALAYGLYSARGIPFVPDIGELLAHRGVGDYTLSMSHFFDLTGKSFAALRLPATIALVAFAVGPVLAWTLAARRKLQPAFLTVALTSAIFLIAAHIALVRFSPMLSSEPFAATIRHLEQTGVKTPDDILLYGDQAYGSSIPFYLDRQVKLVDGKSTSMYFGSTFPDAPNIYLTHDQLLATWGTGNRKFMFVPLEKRDEVDHLLGNRQIILQQMSGKALITDRPLAR
jgi:4-amino-4-deoxy-L-arabinose transferase-like glycosyltransferase